MTSLVAGIASQGSNVSTAVTAAAIETENNALSLRGSAQLMNTLRRCEGSNAACNVEALKVEMARDSAKQNERIQQACSGPSADLSQCMAIANNAQQSAMNLFNASIYADTPEKQALLQELSQQQVRDMEAMETMVQNNAANSTFKDAIMAVVVGSIEASMMAGVQAKKNGDKPKAQQLGGSTIKPQGTDAGGFADSANGKRLNTELSAMSKVKPDTSKDAELKAKTDQSVITNNKFAMDHVLQGEINPSGKATGYHAEFAAEGGARIKPGAQVQTLNDGLYKAPVQIFDASKGQWVDKKFESTFFNPSWSQTRIEYEVSEAFKAGTSAGKSGSFTHQTPSGITIQFHSNSNRTVFHPIGK